VAPLSIHSISLFFLKSFQLFHQQYSLFSFDNSVTLIIYPLAKYGLELVEVAYLLEKDELELVIYWWEKMN